MLEASKIYKDIQNKLQEMDEERVKFFNQVEPFRYAFWTILILGGSFLIIRLNVSSFDYITDQNLDQVIIGYVITVFATLMVFLYVNRRKKSQFKKMFAADIAPYIIRGLDPSFKYDYEGQIPRMEAISSLLFPPFSTYECQDLVTGEINSVSIRFAEIILKKVVVEKDSKKHIPVFSGIFYEANLQAKFPTGIWLILKGKSKTAKEERKTRVKLDHPSLKNYEIYTDSEVVAKQVLQSFILEKIHNLNSKLLADKIIKQPLSFHFENQQVQIAIPTRKKFMEPKLSRTIDHVSFIKEQIVLLNAISTLLEDLTLK